MAFRRGRKIVLQSKSGKPLTRYFPEVAAELLKLKAAEFVLDGELVIAVGKHLSFNDLLMRIHPAASRVRKLAEETPAMYIVFDLLEDASGVLAQETLEVRRPRLEAFAKKEFARAKIASNCRRQHVTRRSQENGSSRLGRRLMASSRSTQMSNIGRMIVRGCRRLRNSGRWTAWSAVFVTERTRKQWDRCCWVFMMKKGG